MTASTDDRRAAIRAELDLLDAEEKLIAAKNKNLSPAKYRELKNEVRSLRQASRERRDAAAAASASPIKATATAKSAGKDA